jgi:cell division septal protein FtsQ
MLLTVMRNLLRYPQALLAAGLIAGGAWLLWGYVQQADAFRVAQVRLPMDSSLKVKQSLIGMNIWAVDLQALARELQAQQPWLKEVRVLRVLPNTLRIQAILRQPVAQVQLQAWYPVDKDGFIIPNGQHAPADRLVRLRGLAHVKAPLKVGAVSTDERMVVALRVLSTLQRSPALISRSVTEIDVEDPQQIKFHLADGTEVRCGSEAELHMQLERLRAALRAIQRRQIEARYIDVRFKEPVVSPQT